MGRVIPFRRHRGGHLPWQVDGRFNADAFDSFVARCVRQLRTKYPERYGNRTDAEMVSLVWNGIRKQFGPGPIAARKAASLQDHRELSPARELSPRVRYLGWGS